MIVKSWLKVIQRFILNSGIISVSFVVSACFGRVSSILSLGISLMSMFIIAVSRRIFVLIISSPFLFTLTHNIRLYQVSPTHARQTLISVCGNMRWWTSPRPASESGKQKMWRPLACVMLRSVTMSVLTSTGQSEVSTGSQWPIRGRGYVIMSWEADGVTREREDIWGLSLILPISQSTTTTSDSSNNTWLFVTNRKSGISWISQMIDESDPCFFAFGEFSLSEEWFLSGSWRVKICQKKRLWAIRGMNEQYLLSFEIIMTREYSSASSSSISTWHFNYFYKELNKYLCNSRWLWTLSVQCPSTAI